MRSSSVNDRVEVCVPSFNHAPFVEVALRSIFSQTAPPARLLVIDDGSRDGSPAVIERVLGDCPFPCELIVRENRGLCATLNEGLAKTSGSLFAYLGSDDTWEPWRIETGLGVIRDRPEGVLSYANAWIIDAEGRRVGCTSDGERYLSGDMRLPLLAGSSVPKSPTVLYRRGPLERFGWNEGSRLEDFELYLKLSGVGPFAFSSRVVGAWRKHGRNVSADVSLMLERVLEAHDRVGPTLGVGPRALARTRAALRFRYASYHLDAGDRATALRQTIYGLPGAPGATAVLKRAVRLATPPAVWRLSRAIVRGGPAGRLR